MLPAMVPVRFGSDRRQHLEATVDSSFVEAELIMGWSSNVNQILDALVLNFLLDERVLNLRHPCYFLMSFSQVRKLTAQN